MFAFALWDDLKKELFLARDRVGIKPLYYTVSNGVFAFSSEIKSLLTLPWIRAELDDEAFYHFLTFNKVFPPDPVNEDTAGQVMGALGSGQGQMQVLQEVGERRQDQAIDPALQELVRATEAPRSDAEGISAYGRKGINPKVSGGIGG